MEYPWQRSEVIQHSQRLLQSFKHWTGRSLLDVGGSPEEVAKAVYEAPFVVVSHGTQADPMLNYGNRKALELWAMEWEQLTQTPSRYTAEPIEREERDLLLERAKAHGFIDDYKGVRISSTGKRFWIEDVVLWNVIDEEKRPCGQAATFSKWTWIES